MMTFPIPWRPMLPGVLALAMFAGCSDGSGASGQTSKEWTRQTMVDACVRMHSCGVFSVTDVYTCITDFEETKATTTGTAAMYKKRHACVNVAAGDCDAIRACFGAKKWDLDKMGPECDSTFVASCEGTKMRACDSLNKRIYVLDCSEAGLSCATDGNGTPFCSAGPCTATKKGNTCSDDKTQRYTCAGNGLQIKQCDWLSLSCGKDRDGKIDCVGTGKECKG
jgi:hypothetical protein